MPGQEVAMCSRKLVMRNTTNVSPMSQSIDTANPPFVGGVITNLAQLAQLAAYMLLGHHLQLFLRVHAPLI